MTKDELKQEAARLGVKVKEGFMDDFWPENALIVAVSLIAGWIAHVIFVFVSK